MMRIPSHLFAVTALIAVVGLEAKAEELLVEVSGVYAKDPKFGESFGSYESELPISFQLLMDESQGYYLPAGTPLIDGQAVAEGQPASSRECRGEPYSDPRERSVD